MKLRPISFFIIIEPSFTLSMEQDSIKVEYDGKVSQKGYRTFEDAEEYVKQQGYIYKESDWKYTDSFYNEALIKEIQVELE